MKVSVDEYNAELRARLREQSRLWEMREQTNSHRELILHADVSRTKPDREFTALLKRAFSHHEITDFRRISRSDIDIKNQAHISKWFHERYFTQVVLKCGTSTDNAALPVDDFFERLIGISTNRPTDNNVQFLVGEIGDGKTTFLCNLIYERWHQFIIRRVVPIRINLDVFLDHHVPSREEVLKIFIDTTLKCFVANNLCSHDEADQLRMISHIPVSHSADKIANSLANLVRVIRDTHRFSILFIIDNVDFLYHLGDRGMFAREVAPEQKLAYEAILDIFRLFSRGDQICARLGLNILHCVRRDTLAYIESQRMEVPFGDLRDRAATIVGVGSHKEGALDVIDKRFELLADLCGRIPLQAKQRDFGEALMRIRDTYHRSNAHGERLFNHLWQLSRNGLRDIIEQFGSYSWIEESNENRGVVTQRFTEQYAPSLLAYVLGGKRRYTQFTAGLPNLYLVNGPAPLNEFGVAPELKQDHFCSFWLKRLILHYLRAREGKFTQVGEFVRTFSGGNGRAYPEDLVRYMAGSLSEVPVAECIKVKMDADGSAGHKWYVSEIAVTRRGKFLVEGFADSFSYLQLVVDDWRLRIPNSLHSELRYVEPDYGYLVAEQHNYGKELERILTKKAKQTIWFALLLEEYLRLEMQIFPNVFRRLREVGVGIPSEGDLVNTLIVELDRITHSVTPQARAAIYGTYCTVAYIDHTRLVVRRAAEELAGPQKSLIDHVY